MNILSAKDFQEVKSWMYRNARPIDLARWQYHFENGGKDAVITALSAYQNSDGGFGLTLEADSWNPNSSPFTTGTAIDILKELQFAESNHPIVQGILKFLDSGAHFAGYGWPFTIPSNSDYPHAPWWTYSEKTNDEYGYFCSAALVGFIFRFADRSSDLYNRAVSIVEAMIEKLRKSEKIDVHELQGYCSVLDDIEQTHLSSRFDCPFLAEKLKKLVDGAIERDPEKWPVYSMRPSMYINSPKSIFYKGNEDIVEKEFHYILASRKECGVWDISWSWGDYQNEFAVSANWWKASWAIRNLMLLKEFNRIDR
jgi:hypothetical protein